MKIDEARTVFNRMYADVNGFDISVRSRKKHNLSSKELTYGEVEFDSFNEILDSAEPNKGDIFYDLGCGTGKAVYIAALRNMFSECIGVEILDEVYETAVGLRKIFYSEAPEITTKVSFIHADLLKVPFMNADIVFLPSTCFDMSFMSLFADACEELVSGARVITLTKDISSKNLELIHRKMYEMSWGDTTVNIYRRK